MIYSWPIEGAEVLPDQWKNKIDASTTAMMPDINFVVGSNPYVDEADPRIQIPESVDGDIDFAIEPVAPWQVSVYRLAGFVLMGLRIVGIPFHLSTHNST